MKNIQRFRVMGALCFALLSFATISLTAQVTQCATGASGVPGINVVEVATRIATMYNADVCIVEAYVQAAVILEQQTGIAAPAVIGIAVHESSFNSLLFINSGNPFGIKASPPWIGPTYSKWDDGAETKFRVYGSAEAAVLDFGDFIKSRTWYADALSCSKNDYVCVINGLQKTDSELGYSTNPLWGEAVLDIIQTIGLQSLITR